LTDRGAGSVQFVLASAVSLVMFLAMANLVVVQYARGAIRSALDQGARVAAVTGSADQCERRVIEVLGQLLGGRMGDSVEASCELGPTLAISQAEAVFVSWTPFAPDFEVSLSATATVEPP
jgi:hypothetical protein